MLGWAWVVQRAEVAQTWEATVRGLLMTWSMSWTGMTGGPFMCLRHELSSARGTVGGDVLVMQVVGMAPVRRGVWAEGLWPVTSMGTTVCRAGQGVWGSP
jgi:hypothetical protein